MISLFEMMVAFVAVFMLGIGAGVARTNELWKKRWQFKMKEIERFYKYKGGGRYE